jgi:hypothetical protein
MIALGLASVTLLLIYGLLAFSSSAGVDPVFWIFVVSFLAYIVWDVRRHLHALYSDPAPGMKPGR